MALFSRLGFSDGEMGLLWVAKILGIIFGLATISLLFFSKNSFLQKSYTAPVAGLLLAINPYFSLWAVSGLESAMFSFLCLLFLLLLSSDSRSRHRHYWRQLVLFLAVLTRPEGGILLVPHLIALFVDNKGNKLNLRLKDWMPLAIGLCGVELFRIFYYGDFLPNTFYAKTLGGWLQFQNGFYYLLFGLFKTMFNGIFVAVLIVYGLITFTRRFGYKLPLTVGLYSLFIIYAGGDWMPGYRFLAHIIPVLMILLALLIISTISIINNRLVKLCIVGVILIITTFGVVVNLRFLDGQYRMFSSGWAGVDSETMVLGDYLSFARDLRDIITPNDYIALGEAGLIPYVSKAHVIDCFGLLDKHIGKLPGSIHEKFDADYVLGRCPEYVLLLYNSSPQGVIGSKFVYVNTLLKDPEFIVHYRLNKTEGQFKLYERVTPGAD